MTSVPNMNFCELEVYGDVPGICVNYMYSGSRADVTDRRRLLINRLVRTVKLYLRTGKQRQTRAISTLVRLTSLHVAARDNRTAATDAVCELWHSAAETGHFIALR